MKFVHAADLHVDSPLRGLDRYEGAPVEHLRGATRRALENLVVLCLEEEVDFLLLAGDVFDGGWKDYSTGLFFSSQMARLRSAKIPVVIVRGNHDAASTLVKSLRLPDNVKELSDKKAETIEIAGAAIHGQSFSTRVTSEDLAAKYPARRPGAFNIGLLHTSLDGRPGHEPYAPTTIEMLRSKGYDYWALGHVHAREILSRDPWIVFPGNLQGRHAREIGEKGASLITVEDNMVKSVEHRALDVVRWVQLEIDTTNANDANDVVDLVRAALEKARDPDRMLAARISITGATRANGSIRRNVEQLVANLRATATDIDDVWLEKIAVETRGVIDRTKLAEEPTAAGHLARRLASIRGDDKELAALAEIFADLEKKLPPELREGDGALHFSDIATLRALVDDVESTILPRLLEGEG